MFTCICTYIYMNMDIYTYIYTHIHIVNLLMTEMCCSATHCNALQHTATHCNTLQHTATHQIHNGVGLSLINKRSRSTAPFLIAANRYKIGGKGMASGLFRHSRSREFVTVECGAHHLVDILKVTGRHSQTSLQHTATHWSTLQHTATHRNTPQHTATHRNTLQHTNATVLVNILQKQLAALCAI